MPVDFSHNYDTFTIHLIAYTCDFVASSFHMTDRDAWAFISPQALEQYALAEADKRFVQELHRQSGPSF